MIPPLTFLWLEITGQCNLCCQHCYAESSPRQSHGVMRPEQWEQVLSDAAHLGCQQVQFIGGEPTLHPALPRLLAYASVLNLRIEVYTNLLMVRPALWDLFQHYHVSIATSFYSATPAIHDWITRATGSFQRTVSHIQHVLELGLPLRVGMIQMDPGQDLETAKRFLCDLGVDPERIGVDHARSVGRGKAFSQVARPEDALCGACARSKAAIMPSGDVYPCVFSRWLPVGNVREASLCSILRAAPMAHTRRHLTTIFQSRSAGQECNPPCEPDDCEPFCEPYDCSPDIPSGCNPTHLCLPDYTPQFPPCNPDTCNPDACSPDKLPPCNPDDPE